MQLNAISTTWLILFGSAFFLTVAKSQDQVVAPSDQKTKIESKDQDAIPKIKPTLAASNKSRTRGNNDTILSSEQISEDFAVSFPVDI